MSRESTECIVMVILFLICAVPFRDLFEDLKRYWRAKWKQWRTHFRYALLLREERIFLIKLLPHPAFPPAGGFSQCPLKSGCGRILCY